MRRPILNKTVITFSLLIAFYSLSKPLVSHLSAIDILLISTVILVDLPKADSYGIGDIASALLPISYILMILNSILLLFTRSTSRKFTLINLITILSCLGVFFGSALSVSVFGSDYTIFFHLLLISTALIFLTVNNNVLANT